jgi:hypothetical protein
MIPKNFGMKRLLFLLALWMSAAPALAQEPSGCNKFKAARQGTRDAYRQRSAESGVRQPD